MLTRATSDQSVPSLRAWPARSYVATFVRCLHLLDLDLLEDWPVVTEQLFTPKTAQQSLQQRVKAVEWSLFRLFEIYDPQETRDKLRPFFPPTSQLQSLNLRAALYRCLSELKKTGALSKDALLRKTMLDDCKGERFEEVIASLAMITLGKAARTQTSPPQEVALSERSLPVHLAYRVSLRNNLLARGQIHSNTKRQFEYLVSLQQDLETRLDESRTGRVHPAIAKQKEVHVLVSTSWIGNNTWANVLLHGIPKPKLLDTDIAKSTASVTIESQSLFRDLDARIQRHSTRLSQWRVVAKDLKASSKQESSPVKPASVPRMQAEIPQRFREHKLLQLSGLDAGSTALQPLEDTYQRLIGKMKQEFFRTAVAADLAEANHPPPTILAAHVDSTAEYSPSEFLEDPNSRFEQQRVLVNSSEVVPAESADQDRDSTRYDSSGRSDSPSTIRSTDEGSLWIPGQSSATTLPADNVEPTQSSSLPTLNIPEDVLSPSSMWMSLADRTRASISFVGRQSILNDPHSPTSEEAVPSETSALPELHPPSDDDCRSTLIERTRKSMSLFSGSMSRPVKTRAEKRTSQIYPVNQFETPGRPQRQSDWKPNSGASTPREQLFDEEAEYASVFKSRPKLAPSPAFSPERRSSDLRSFLADDMDRLDLDSDAD